VRTSLGASSSCTIAVTFAPTSDGTIDGALAIATGGAFSPQMVALSGKGKSGPAVPLSFSPTTLKFSSTGIGATSAAKTITVTNSSGSSVTINSLSASANYAVAGSGSSPCGGALAASAKCTLSVTFTPSDTGSNKGAVAIATSGAGSPQIVDVSGTGELPVACRRPASLSAIRRWARPARQDRYSDQRLGSDADDFQHRGERRFHGYVVRQEVLRRDGCRRS
jgi:hypothetical protein